MCNTRAYKHGCGHYTSHIVSYCRGTYACPRSERVLCNAVPSLTVTVPKSCRDCQWKSFREQWDGRLSAARSKLSVAHQVQSELQEDFIEANVTTGFGPNDWGAVDRAAERLSVAKAEAGRAQGEVDVLVAQYERERSTKFRPSLATIQTRMPNKRRDPKKRLSGCSPLKASQHVDDLPTEPARPTIDTTMARWGSWSSVSSEGSLPELSSDFGDISPPDSPPASPPFGRREISFEKIGTTWSKDFWASSPAIIDDDEDDEFELLPNF